MAKKKSKEISLDDLEEELADTEDLEEEKEEIEEIDEFSLDEISEEEEVGEVFKEELEEFEEIEEAPKEEIIDERIYVIPLAKARRGPRNKWAKKAIRYLREFMERHFKPETLVISQEVNEAIWARGIQKPPRKIKIRATKNIDGLVVCYLAE
ncbi:MAG: 50S ribosomal protein L31e [Promethearchaeota archaeon]|jgi:large subunit ribosomal protein L31e